MDWIYGDRGWKGVVTENRPMCWRPGLDSFSVWNLIYRRKGWRLGRSANACLPEFSPGRSSFGKARHSVQARNPVPNAVLGRPGAVIPPRLPQRLGVSG